MFGLRVLNGSALLGVCMAAIAIQPSWSQSETAVPRLRALEFPAIDQALPDSLVGALDGVMPGSSILDMQEGMADGDITSEILVTYLLDRIALYDEDLRTYLEINPNALDEAREADRLRAEGTVLGPLHGIPVSLKDNIETAGPMHTTAGAELLLDNVATDDAELVQQLRAAGAVILGKANLSEFAGSISQGPLVGGTTAVGGQGINPYGDFPTGGSSSGSAGGVSALLAVVSVGSETSGSLIAPSSWQGVVGMKPSAGLVSGDGVVPLLLNNDSAGPIARQVIDAAILLDAIDTADVDYAGMLDSASLTGAIAGVLASDLAGSPASMDLLERISSGLTLAGARIVPAAFENEDERMARFTDLLAAGVRHDMMPYVTALHPEIDSAEALVDYNDADPARRAPFNQETFKALVGMSGDVSREQFDSLAVELTETATNLLEETFAATGADVLVSINNIHSMVYATAGYPAITVPLGAMTAGGLPTSAGFDGAGMPVGVVLIGKKGMDADLLSYAYAFEQVTHLRMTPELHASPAQPKAEPEEPAPMAEEPVSTPQADVSTDDTEALTNAVCTDAVAFETGDNNVAVVGNYFSEAATEVLLEVGDLRAPWQCIVSNDGVVQQLQFMGDDSAGVVAPAHMDADVTPAMVDSCLAAVLAQTNEPDQSVTETLFSEANSLVKIAVGSGMAPWECLISNDGVVQQVTFMGDDSAGVDPSVPAPMAMDASVTPAMVDACLAAVLSQTNEPNQTVIETLFSEANSMVMIGVGPDMAPWQCLISNDGVVQQVMFAGSEGAM